MSRLEDLRRSVPGGRVGGAVVATALCLGTLVVLPAASSAAVGVAPATTRVVTASTTPAAKPTIVLVHGAFADASGWSAEIQHLTKLGYPVMAPANPLRGVASDAHYIDTVLATIPGPVVLVGHSYGGAVIAAAANAAPNVKALVYVSAFIPEPGRSASYYTSGDNFPGSLLNQSTLVFKPTYNPTLSVTQPKPGETPKNNDADVYINPADFRAIFAADRSPAQAALMAAEQRPVSAAAYVENSYPAAKLPSWDLVSLDDKAIPPAAQQYMAQRAGARVTAIHSAHDSLITHPQVVDGLILQAAKSIRAPVPASKILLRRSGSSPCRPTASPAAWRWIPRVSSCISPTSPKARSSRHR